MLFTCPADFYRSADHRGVHDATVRTIEAATGIRAEYDAEGVFERQGDRRGGAFGASAQGSLSFATRARQLLATLPPAN
jgi:hypothetical protein